MELFLIVSTPVYITLFWAVTFLSSGVKRNRPRHLLGFFMLVAAVLYSCHAVYFMGNTNLYLKLDALYIASTLSVYPLFYIYIKLLTREVNYHWFNALHFGPAFLLGAASLTVNLASTPEQQLRYMQLVLVDNNWASIFVDGPTGWLALAFFGSRIVYALQVLYYGRKTYRLITGHNKLLAHYYSNLENRQLKWVKVAVIALIGISVAGFTGNLLGRGVFAHNVTSLLIASVTFSSLLFVVGLFGNKQSSSVSELISDEMNFNILASGPIDGRSKFCRQRIRENLSQLMKEEQLYLIPDLKITQLCSRLRVDRSTLARLMEEEYGENFNTYVNRHRVSYARHIMKHQIGQSPSLNHWAKESGFSTTDAFAKAFRRIEGTAPQLYRTKKTVNT